MERGRRSIRMERAAFHRVWNGGRSIPSYLAAPIVLGQCLGVEEDMTLQPRESRDFEQI